VYTALTSRRTSPLVLPHRQLTQFRLLAICLGRPLGIEDTDCNCEIPLDLDDHQLETYCRIPSSQRTKPSIPSRLSGFIAFSRLCQIAGKVIRAMNPLHMRTTSPKRLHERQILVSSLDAELAEWLRTVPDGIRFSANDLNADSAHLTMCVILYIVHAGCVINLHRYEYCNPQKLEIIITDVSFKTINTRIP
jgi:hypothetical protein